MKYLFTIINLLLLAWQLQAAPLKIVFWHSMSGNLGSSLKQLIEEFNLKHPKYKIYPVYKGDYIESLTSFAAAFHAHTPPHILQVAEVTSNMMIYPSGVVKSVASMADKYHINLPLSNQTPLSSYLMKNQLWMGLPFNTSVPVMFYNKEALQKIGYNKNDFPKTWQELGEAAKKLINLGYDCAITTAYPSWIHLESIAALHGINMYDPDSQSFSYNIPLLREHLVRLQNWQLRNWFVYGGRGDEATIFFTSNKCPIFSQSSGAYQSLQGMVSFPVGVAPIPIDAKYGGGKRYSNVIGGAAVWAIAGFKPEIYEGIIQFFQFWLQEDVQRRWHQQTGYLPLVSKVDAKKILTASLQPIAHDYNQEQLTSRRNNPIPWNLVRQINDEEIEEVFSGTKDANTALAQAVKRANKTTKRFYRNTHIFN